jgi:hypothetical protein
MRLLDEEVVGDDEEVDAGALLGYEAASDFLRYDGLPKCQEDAVTEGMELRLAWCMLRGERLLVMLLEMDGADMERSQPAGYLSASRNMSNRSATED